MPKIVAKAFMDVPAGAQPTDEMSAKWVESFQRMAMETFRRMMKSVPNPEAFASKIGDVSNQEWKGMLNPSFRSKSELTASEINNRQMGNLSESYKKWKEKLEYLFAEVDGVEAKRFKDLVANAESRWSKGISKTLRFTGDKVRGRGVAPWAGYFLTGDKRAIGMMPAGGQVTGGGAINVAKTGQRTTLKAGLIEKLVQAGIIITESKYDPDVVKEQNEFINGFIAGLQDSAFAQFQAIAGPGNSYCLYIVEGANLKLEIQVVEL
ncbi:MAG: hypothetical protein WC980_05755 [Candidatus Brocadiia bacterium]